MCRVLAVGAARFCFAGVVYLHPCCLAEPDGRASEYGGTRCMAILARHNDLQCMKLYCQH
jgi:hypothetical protein